MLENIIFIVTTLLFNTVTAFFLFKDKIAITSGDNNVPMLSKRFLLIYSGIFFVINILIVVLFINLYEVNSLIFSLKRLCMLSILWPVGLIDFKDYRIPNKFIIVGLIFRVAILIPEIIFESKYVIGNLISEVVAAVAIALAAFLCSICFKNSIRYGDIKLFIIMGLFLGLNGIWSSIFMSLIIAFFVAIFLLISKKKGKKDVVPFAPSIMIGTYISVILTGM